MSAWRGIFFLAHIFYYHLTSCNRLHFLFYYFTFFYQSSGILVHSAAPTRNFVHDFKIKIIYLNKRFHQKSLSMSTCTFWWPVKLRNNVNIKRIILTFVNLKVMKHWVARQVAHKFFVSSDKINRSFIMPIVEQEIHQKSKWRQQND